MTPMVTFQILLLCNLRICSPAGFFFHDIKDIAMFLFPVFHVKELDVNFVSNFIYLRFVGFCCGCFVCSGGGVGGGFVVLFCFNRSLQVIMVELELESQHSYPGILPFFQSLIFSVNNHELIRWKCGERAGEDLFVLMEVQLCQWPIQRVYCSSLVSL